MELKDLEEDKIIGVKLQNLHDSIQNIQKFLDAALEIDTAEYSSKDKVDLDLFVTYALNTLYWMYLRTKGEDPNTHDVKNQLNRVKEYMIKAREAHERLTLRPKVDQAAAGRFVKHGIKYRDKKPCGQTPKKKMKFTD
ncbi:nuclear nucleic acid-binding protein C1D [Euwallacea fornicatus]|uniref:nuclear nucleic acid-binding protein C1D n=1 Tax=Euwallacea fornicatus TaxID=995702 RepID=UPI0033903FB9